MRFNYLTIAFAVLAIETPICYSTSAVLHAVPSTHILEDFRSDRKSFIGYNFGEPPEGPTDKVIDTLNFLNNPDIDAKFLASAIRAGTYPELWDTINDIFSGSAHFFGEVVETRLKVFERHNPLLQPVAPHATTGELPSVEVPHPLTVDYMQRVFKPKPMVSLPLLLPQALKRLNFLKDSELIELFLRCAAVAKREDTKVAWAQLLVSVSSLKLGELKESMESFLKRSPVSLRSS